MRERARLFVRLFGRACVCGNVSTFYLNEKVKINFRFFKILVDTRPRFFSLLRSDDASSRTDDE